jgi:hypothetical protein
MEERIHKALHDLKEISFILNRLEGRANMCCHDRKCIEIYLA